MTRHFKDIFTHFFKNNVAIIRKMSTLHVHIRNTDCINLIILIIDIEKPSCRVTYMTTLCLYAVVRGVFTPPGEDDFTNTYYVRCVLCVADTSV